MAKQSWFVTTGLAVLALGIAPAANAYFEIELESGGTVVAESYTEVGGKLHLYRPAGELEVDRTAVKSIRERDGSLVEDAAPKPAAEAVRPSVVATKPAGVYRADDAASVEIPTVGDPAVIERALTRKLILANRDLLFARNGGEDTKSLEARQKEIEKLQERRESLREKLGP